MMKKTTLVLGVACAALSTVSFAQSPYTMTNLWKVDVGTSLTWFLNNNNTRGLTYNAVSDHVLVPNRDSVAGNKVHKLDPATGADGGTLDDTGVSGGTFPINLINVTPDGKLFLTNLAAATSTFKIYTYANEAAAPVNSYSEAGVAVRYGDAADVRVNGSNIELLVSGSGNPNVAVFTSSDGGTTFTKQDITLDTGLAGITYVKWDPTVTNAFLARKAASSGTETPALKRYTVSGANGTLDTAFGSKLATLAGVGAFDAKVTANGHMLIATTYANATSGATNLYGLIHEIPSEALVAQTATGLEAGSAANANLNGSGAAAIDLASKRVWFLYTNNSMSGWNIPTPVASSVADWNLY